MNVFSVIICK